MAVWQQADHIAIPLLDGTFSLAQVIEVTDHPNPAALCALTLRKGPQDAGTTPLLLREVIAVQYIRPPQNSDTPWSTIGFEQIPRIRDIIDLDHHIANGFADMTPQDPAVIEAFVNACHGLYPWDGFPDPEFFTSMLRWPEHLPQTAKLRAELPK